ncbi:MAG: hypothetical protein R6U38_15365 [Desulfatiglandaceae bacterium]
MKTINQGLAHRLLLILTALFLLSCTSIPEMQILYRLPAPSDDLQDRQITLTLKDIRKSKAILKKGAREEFEGFSGNLSLSVAHDDEGFKVGIFTVMDIFKEAMTRRLKQQGLEVLSEKRPGQPQLSIVLKKFNLDLEDRDWIAAVEYEARLMKDDRTLISQVITADGERYKIVGRKQADALMGEIFTDAINSLNLPRLLEQARSLEQ